MPLVFRWFTSASLPLAMSALLGLACSAQKAANAKPSVIKPDSDPLATTLRLGMELKRAEALLTRQQVVFSKSPKNSPIPGKSVVIQGEYPGASARISLYFVDEKLWEIKLRDSEELCKAYVRDLGTPVVAKAGCWFWADKSEWFSAFHCPSTIESPSLPKEGATCFFVSLKPLASAGLGKAELEAAFKEIQPPSP
jgi:hypothetical protein